jgi:hypothetical protein
MSKNLMSKPWYPKIGKEGKTQNFVYLDTLYSDNPTIYNKAQNLFASTSLSLYGNLWPQMNDLLNLAKREQDKEDRLLDLFFNETNANS